MRGIHQHIPFAADRRRRNEKGSALSAAYPVVSDPVQRLVSGFAPVRRERFFVKPVYFDRGGNVALNRNQIGRSEIRLKIYKDLDRGERE
jgi:hypothetical protein